MQSGTGSWWDPLALQHRCLIELRIATKTLRQERNDDCQSLRRVKSKRKGIVPFLSLAVHLDVICTRFSVTDLSKTTSIDMSHSKYESMEVPSDHIAVQVNQSDVLLVRLESSSNDFEKGMKMLLTSRATTGPRKILLSACWKCQVSFNGAISSRRVQGATGEKRCDC